MLDSKFFVSRFDDPFPDLYERLWDGVEWIWVNHGRPDGCKMATGPGAAMMDEKLFVVVDDGSLRERHWRNDLGRWAWENHGRPENRRIIAGPGAAMMDEKLFVVTDTGNLWERHWRNDLNRWAWQDHGRPDNRKIVTSPACAMMGEKLFVVTETGDLWERHWRTDLSRWAWNNHGRPNSEKIVHTPGAAINDEKLFVVTDTGNLWERHWRNDLGRWAWQDHGRPDNERLVTSPGAAMMDEKLFVGGANGNLYERHWRNDLGRWAWEDHGRPPGTQVATAPGAAMMNSKLFVGTSNSHLFERTWTGSEWAWVDHGTAFHDQSAHIIGRPGSDPKMTIAVMGDGYAERDMDDYRNTVEDKVLEAFQLGELGENHDKIRLIRIDVASPVTGVTEFDYDERSTPEVGDDVLVSSNFRFSRLGYISTGIWSHCWLETSPRTNPRIDSIRQRFAPAATNVIVLVNTSEPGGCNRSNIAAFSKSEGSVTIAHELGHNLFDLGDEYNNDDQDFTGIATEVNLTEEPASWNLLKWRDLVATGTPLPTDSGALPGGWDNESSVGAFEGGGADFATGIFRPVLRCRMNQNSPPWCPVCAREIERIFGAFP
jgi:hypothetical protein